ncbi:MAG: histidine kinase, partial [Flavobacteriales bacterium]|nr:histidine kinase [Flavobacteriales bacterium]
DSSYDYIVLFAKLVRNTLNYSNLDFISIDKELEFLNTYLLLEKLRFAEDFEYSVNYSGSKEIDIPSLLIQPFVENAIVHGLMHKKGKKQLSIDFELNDKMICTIVDNGVGRKRAREIRLRRSGEHKSFAMQAIKQRLKLLNKQLGDQTGDYKIEDIMVNEEVVGTKVTLTLPHKSHF